MNLLISLAFAACLKSGKLLGISYFNRNIFTTKSNPLTRFQGPKRSSSILMGLLTLILTMIFWYFRGNNIDDGYYFYLSRGKKSTHNGWRGASKTSDCPSCFVSASYFPLAYLKHYSHIQSFQVCRSFLYMKHCHIEVQVK